MSDLDHWQRKQEANTKLSIISKATGIAAIQIGLCVAFAMGAHSLIPDRVIEKRIIVTEKKVRVVTEKLTVPKPSNVKYAPLSDPKKACSGAPVVIASVTISKAKGADDKESETTWLRVRPAGDEYLVACRLGGAWPEFKAGDLVSLIQGEEG